MLFKGVNLRLEDAKGNWKDELSHVLWVYRTTPHSTTGETYFLLTNNNEVAIHMEVEELIWRTPHSLPEEDNN